MSQSTHPYYFTGYIQDGKVFTQNYDGSQQIGVTLSVHTELSSRHEELLKSYSEYQSRLVELGEIELPLTQEQVIQKQADTITRLEKLLNRMEKNNERVETSTGVSRERHKEAESIQPSMEDGTDNKSEQSRNTKFSPTKQRQTK